MSGEAANITDDDSDQEESSLEWSVSGITAASVLDPMQYTRDVSNPPTPSIPAGNGIDEIVISRDLQLARAKEACLELANNGYSAPKKEKNVTVLGKEGLGLIYVGSNSMLSGNYMSEHDGVISEKLGFVLCGGDLSENTVVSEQYLLNLERKAFVELCLQRKTLERLESLVKYGKILRN